MLLALSVGSGGAADTPSAANSRPGELSTQAPSRAKKVNLNSASLEELESLPGVGPATAAAIIKARPFKNINELTNVTGIGSAKLAALKPYVSVRPVRASAVGKPASGEKASSSEHLGKSPPNSTHKIDLNTATKEELESLPDIGPVRAQAIIDARPFSSIEDVMKVKGIKQGVFNKIKDQIRVK